jgi:hypothetical protein
MRARSKVTGRPFVNALRLCGVDASSLAITDEAKLHLGDHAQHSQDHPAHRPAGVDGWVQHSSLTACIGRPFHNGTEHLEKLFELYTKIAATSRKAKKVVTI